MNTPTEIRRIADQRLLEAKILVASPLIASYEGAYYLAGYCVELYLKAKICETLDLNDLFSDTSSAKKVATVFKSHRLEELMLLTGLNRKFESDLAANKDLANAWSYITKWNEAKRYVPLGQISKLEAEKLIYAIEDLKNGFLQWILQH